MEKDKEIVEKLRVKDEAFRLYCEEVNKIPDFQENKAKRDAIEEHWALFLKKVEVQKMPNGKII